MYVRKFGKIHDDDNDNYDTENNEKRTFQTTGYLNGIKIKNDWFTQHSDFFLFLALDTVVHENYFSITFTLPIYSLIFTCYSLFL